MGSVPQDQFVVARQEHLAAAIRALRRHAGDCRLSHESAAIAVGLPTYRIPPRPQLTRPDGHRRTRGRTDVAVAAMPAKHIALVETPDLVPITSMARTVIDVARDRPFLEALVTADAALRRGLRRQELLDVLADMPRWPGTVAAYKVVQCADGRAESAAESVTRGRFIVLDLPLPDLQVWVEADGGRRVDFLWEEVQLIGEVDGRIKYQGPDGEQVLWEEKQRRDALEDEKAVIRWNWRQAHAPDNAFIARFKRAWIRAQRWKQAS